MIESICLECLSTLVSLYRHGNIQFSRLTSETETENNTSMSKAGSSQEMGGEFCGSQWCVETIGLYLKVREAE